MNNLKVLIKNNFNMFLGIFKSKKKGISTYRAILSLLIMVVAIVGIYTASANSTFLGLAPEISMFNACLISFSVVLALGIMRTTSTKQKSNDTDLLLSLPIKRSEIVISKALNKYLFDLFFSAALFLPYTFIYLVKVQYSTPFLLLSFLIVFMLPLLSVGIGYILGFFFDRVFNRTKHANFYKSLCAVITFVCLMIFMLSKSLFYGTSQAQDLVGFMSDRPMSYLMVKIIFNHRLLDVFKLVSICVVPFIVGIALFALNFGKTFSSFYSNKKELKYNAPKSEFGGFLKKETNTYFSTPIWVSNTIIAPLLYVGLIIIILATGRGTVLKYIKMFQEYNGINYVYFLAGLILSGLTATACISCSSISLEGKNFWIIKSSPINEKKYLMSKIVLNLLVVLPTLIICTSIIAIMLKFSFFGFLFTLSLPVLLCIVIAFGGLYINIKHPKFEFDDEQQVVKQSMAMFLTLALGFLLTFLPIGLPLIFTNMALTTVMIITVSLYTISAIGSIILTFTHGLKLYRKL